MRDCTISTTIGGRLFTIGVSGDSVRVSISGTVALYRGKLTFAAIGSALNYLEEINGGEDLADALTAQVEEAINANAAEDDPNEDAEDAPASEPREPADEWEPE